MAFSIIKAEDRVLSMIDWFSGMCSVITDFAIGSKIRTKFETVAVEMERQDYEFEQAVREAIPVACFETFGFDTMLASKASGVVRFTAASAPANDIRISKGTQIATTATTDIPEKIYQLLDDAYLIASNTYIDALVVAVVAGTSGNTAASTINVIKNTISGVDTVVNSGAFVNGTDAETADARRIRFQQYIASLDRSTSNSVEYGAKTAQVTTTVGETTTVERVAQAKVREPYREAGTNILAGNILCYIYNGTGSTSNGLITQTQKVVDGYIDTDGTPVVGYKAAGVVCTVKPVSEVAQAINATIVAYSNKSDTEKAAIIAAARTQIGTYVKSLNVQDKLIKSKLIDIIMGIDGVYNCTVTNPAADVAPTALLVAGSVTIAAGAKTFTRAAGNFLTDGWRNGISFDVNGFTNAGNNGTFIVTNVTATVVTASAAAGLVNETAAAANMMAFYCVVTTPNLETDTITIMVAGSVTIVASAKTFTRAAGNFLTDGWKTGLTFNVNGFTNASNNGTFVITSVTETVITASAATGLVNETATAVNMVAS
jgi:phage-related baseplate assembly protein